jgi:type 1 glutamine amidotransferase
MQRPRTMRISVGAMACLAISCASTTPEQEAPRILVFSKTAAFRHGSIPAGIAAIRQVAEAEGIGVDASEDASTFTPDALAAYDAIVFLSTTGDVLDDEQQAALTAYVRGGGGFAGIHSASDTEYDWEWYGRLVGAYFDGHPSNPGVRPGTLLVTSPRHPATEGLPSPWMRDDEWYDLRDLQANLTVLLEIDESSYKLPEEEPAPEPRPIAWYHEFDGGRAFYTALGHTEESWAEAGFLDHVWGGITMVMRSPRPPG